MKSLGHYCRLFLLLASLILIIAPISLSSRTSITSADYATSDGVINPSAINQWLYDNSREGAEAGAKAGAKSVATHILTPFGRALLDSYAPELADMLFGSSDAEEEQTRRIIEEIRRVHLDLANRHREAEDERIDQFVAETTPLFNVARNSLNMWLAADHFLERWENRDLLRQANESLDTARDKIETYIDRGTGPRTELQRLELMQLHIASAQLAVIVSQYYWGITAIHTAFVESPFGSDYGQFNQWVVNLSEDAVADMVMHQAAEDYRRDIYNHVLDFYATLADRDPFADYVDAFFTPAVSQMARFSQSTSLFDEPEFVNSEDSWRVSEGGAFPLLDGLRWYYYFRIPRAECLDGFAFDALVMTRSIPWSEVAGEPAASDCNRFWIVDLDLSNSRWPNTYLGSFDGYSIWFDNPDDILRIHKQLIHGDLLRFNYGPVSLILDRMYEELYGGIRPPNHWDRIFVEYDRQVALLGISDSYSDGLSYDDALTASRELEEWGVKDTTVGLGCWFESIKAYIAASDRTDQALLPRCANQRGWVLADQPVESSYVPRISYNSSGGSTRVNRRGDGQYQVVFNGLATRGGSWVEATRGGTVQVAAYGGSHSCKVIGWVRSGSDQIVNVRCFDPHGVPGDGKFTAAFYKESRNAASMGAYLWANRSTTSSYTPSSTYQWNSKGLVNTVRRLDTGFYEARLPGMDQLGGTVLVTAYGRGTERCKVDHWFQRRGNTLVYVRCFDPNHMPVDTRYTLGFMEMTPDAVVAEELHHGGYVWTDRPEARSYTPSPYYQLNSSGQTNTVTKLSRGSYRVHFPGLISGGDNIALVTAYGESSEYCNLSRWLADGRGGTYVFVRCYTGPLPVPEIVIERGGHSGFGAPCVPVWGGSICVQPSPEAPAPVDTRFTLTYLMAGS